MDAMFSFKKIDMKFIGITILGICICFFGASFIQKEETSIQELPSDIEVAFEELRINEVVTKNKGVYADSENNVCDYIELYNGSDIDIDLEGYGLSDEQTKIKFVFHNVTILAKSYLVVSCTGNTSENPLEVSFKLSSSESERIILTSPSKKVIDEVDTLELSENTCMGRDSNGKWVLYAYCTPGQENSVEGLEAYQQSLISEEENDELVVNEFLARNKGNYLSDNDNGYIEFKNISDHTIYLNDYFISDDSSLPFKKSLGEAILKPNEIVVFECGDGTYYEDNYLGFNFDSKNGTIVLSKKGKIVETIKYSGLNNGDSLCYSSNGYYETCTISKGYENNSEGIDQFYSENFPNKKDLLISEVMNNNYSYLVTNGNHYYDWIELYNNSNQTISLSDYTLSNEDCDFEMYLLPDIELKQGERIVILCSGDESLSGEYYHANFKIQDNDSIYLSKNGELIDCLHIGHVPNGYSVGRNNKDGYYYMEPTPLEENKEGYRSVTSDPIIETENGIYNDIDTLNVSITFFDNTYYTTNGDEPTTSDLKVEGPITINKTTTLRLKSFGENAFPSDTVTATYVLNENHTMPVICLSLNAKDLKNINQNYKLHDYNFEGYVEYFEEDGSFESKCGIGLFGDESRQYAKKNYVMKFDKEFGADNLHYPVFEDRKSCDYDVLSLRAGGQDWDGAIIRDSFLTSCADDCVEIHTYASKDVILYINGEYWGIYSLKEKKSKNYFENNFNVDGDSVNLFRASDEIDWGSNESYKELLNYCNSIDAKSDEFYEYMSEHLNLTNWADYWIAQLYVANLDYYNVRYFSSPDIEDGKWECLFFDLDFGMSAGYDYDSYRHSFTSRAGFNCYWWLNGEKQEYVENTIIRCLLQNPKFEELWLTRLKYNLETTWNKDRLLSIFSETKKLYESEIVRDRSRWNQSLEVWYQEMDVIEEFINKRESYVLKYTQSFYKLSDEKMKEIFGKLYG